MLFVATTSSVAKIFHVSYRHIIRCYRCRQPPAPALPPAIDIRLFTRLRRGRTLVIDIRRFTARSR